MKTIVMCSLALALMIWGDSSRSRTFAEDPPWASRFPKIILQTQDGKDVQFYEDLIKGKTVLINFMYTRCDGEFCVRGMPNLVRVQNALGNHLGEDVFMYSISLDPKDNARILKDYAARIGARPGWTFLTGKPEDITKLRRTLGLFSSDPKKESDLKQHTGMIRVANEPFNRWSMSSILSDPERILQIIERMKPPVRPKE